MCEFEAAGLNRDNVLCLGAFLAISNVELDFLAVSQGTETVALDSAEVNEHIGTIFALDEAEALAFVKPLNGACS